MDAASLSKIEDICKRQGLTDDFARVLVGNLHPLASSLGTEDIIERRLGYIVRSRLARGPVLLKAGQLDLGGLVAAILGAAEIFPPTTTGATVRLLAEIIVVVRSMRVNLAEAEMELIRTLMDYATPETAVDIIAITNRRLPGHARIVGNGELIVRELQSKGARIEFHGTGDRATVELTEFVI